jgi:virginiamycin B lyase
LALVGALAAALAWFGWNVWQGRALPWSAGAPDGRGFQEYRLPDRGAFPVALAVAPEGPAAKGAAPAGSAVWFTMEASDRIGVLREGAFHFVRKTAESIEPLGLAVDASGAAWFTDAPRQTIGRARGDGTTESFPLGTPISRLGRLAAAADGAVWFAEPSRASVTRFKDGAFVRHPVRTDNVEAVPYGIALAPDGSVWATLQFADALFRIAPNGQASTINVPIPNAGLTDVAVAPDGAVWFLAAGASRIGRYAGGRFEDFAVPGSLPGLTALAVAPDGAAWYTALRTHRIGRVHQGKVVEFALPRADARPIGIAVDAQNNVWYADLTGWIGKLAAERARAL